jgi:hypothetical protein
MAFISTAVSNWDQCASFLGEGGAGHGTVNAISIDNLYHFSPTKSPMLSIDAAAIEKHTSLWVKGGYRTYPMIGFGRNITELRVMLLNSTAQQDFVGTLVSEAVRHTYDGINIDFEPLTDVMQPNNNPTAHDALALVDLLSLLGTRLHAVNKTLSLDAMAVTGACWTKGGHEAHPLLDLKPCPWIRRLWDLSALSAVDTIDRIISMDTYTAK